MGYAYTILARLLLIVHDPTIPTLGPQRRQAVAEIDVRSVIAPSLVPAVTTI